MTRVGPSFKLPGAPHCPKCGKKIDGASSLESDDAPGPGDVTVCIYCAAILTYRGNMSVRKLSPAQVDALDVETRLELAKIKAAIRMLWEKEQRSAANETKH